MDNTYISYNVAVINYITKLKRQILHGLLKGNKGITYWAGKHAPYTDTCHVSSCSICTFEL